jgi:metal-responsive CopG/Arc/MetJ family transcriptional regulator
MTTKLIDHTGDYAPRIITPIPTELIRQIDEFRFNTWRPSRSEAIRQLIRDGLRANEMKTTAVPSSAL